MTDPVALRTASRPPRLDAVSKVRGGLRYCGDLPPAGVLHARLVTAPVAHAVLNGVDAGAALDLPGVLAVLTAADLPIAEPDDSRVFQPLANGEILWAGHPVAIVVAETEAAAEDGVEAVSLDYTALEAVLDLEAAARPDSPRARRSKHGRQASLENVHGAIGAPESETIVDEELSDNVVRRYLYRSGDVDAVMAQCDVVLQRRYRAGWVHQVPLEAPVAVASVDADGALTVHTSTQALFITRDMLASVFGLPQTKVRVVATPMGGSFGSKFALAEPLAAGAALALGRPVRLAMTRTEDFLASNPAAAAVMDVRVGASARGDLEALDARLMFDDGAFADLSCEMLAAFCIGGPYRWRAFRVKALGAETNRFGTGAYRAPGAPQAIFALESLIDELAQRTGRDALELRLDNLVGEGDPRIDGIAWSRTGMRQCLERLRDHPLWQRRSELPENEGVGVAAGVWTGARDAAGAVCRLDGDGTVTIVTGIADMTGAESTLAALAAAELDLPLEHVRMVSADTTAAPYAPPSGGSSATYLFGPAVRAAAREVRDQLIELAADELEAAVEDLELAGGEVRVKGAEFRAIGVAALAESVWSFGGSMAPVQAQSRTLAEHAAPLSSANLVHLRVDPDTHEVTVLSCVAVQDVGHALNPALIEAQIEGGAAQGIGRALLEELVHDGSGVLVTDSLMGYALPVAEGTPRIEIQLVEEPSDEGPWGARGVGEAPVLAVPAAVGNAIGAATGLRMTALPMTAARIWRARQDDAR